MQQGQVQLRLIKDLLLTGYDYMELHDFADAYRSALRERNSNQPATQERWNWDYCVDAIGLLASMRFGSIVWLEHLAEPASLPNLTVTRE
jgi:hypothetical protein